jgi:CDGSH-type Zn-finger protein
VSGNENGGARSNGNGSGAAGGRAAEAPGGTASGPAGAQPARITPYRDGPLLVRGPFLLADQDGNEIEVGRRVVALCRCGKSRIRPFCDGTHKTIGFQAESSVENPELRSLSESERAAADSA